MCAARLEVHRARPRGTALSQPPHPSVAPAGPYAQSGLSAPAAQFATAGAPAPQPAAPTQVAFPGQVQLPPQPQFTPSPQQAPRAALASGFPRYVPPPPSPVNRTGLYVGILVCVLTLLFAVIGFVLVA
jgi:hypothetical protein